MRTRKTPWQILRESLEAALLLVALLLGTITVTVGRLALIGFVPPEEVPIERRIEATTRRLQETLQEVNDLVAKLEAETNRLGEANKQLQLEQEQRRIWLKQNPSELAGLFQAYRDEVMQAYQRQSREQALWAIIGAGASFVLGLLTDWTRRKLSIRRMQAGDGS